MRSSHTRLYRPTPSLSRAACCACQTCFSRNQPASLASLELRPDGKIRKPPHTPTRFRFSDRDHRMRASTLAVLLGAVHVTTAASPDQVPLTGDGSRRPNVVFILTDDQDVHLQSLEYMPLVKKHILDQGTLYRKHYCTTAVCCPSRVTLWTGKAAHNTNITDVNPPYGIQAALHWKPCTWADFTCS